ncbi:MAG: tetratricopeptide repeat protein [Pyrinomonadaceae bacterium]
MNTHLLIILLLVWIAPIPAGPQVNDKNSTVTDAVSYQKEGIKDFKQGRHQESVATLRRVVHLKPDDALAHYYLGVALNTLSSHSEAAESLSKAILLQPAYPRNKAQTWLFAGAIQSGNSVRRSQEERCGPGELPHAPGARCFNGRKALQ